MFCHFQREELAPVPIRLTRTCYTLLRKMSDLISNLKTSGNTSTLYRVIQEGSAILWEMIVCVILSKKVHMNMGPILNGYRDMVKRRYGPSCEHEQQLRNNITCMQVLTIVLLMICNGQNPGSSTSGTSHNKRSKMPPPTSMHKCIEVGGGIFEHLL